MNTSLVEKGIILTEYEHSSHLNIQYSKHNYEVMGVLQNKNCFCYISLLLSVLALVLGVICICVRTGTEAEEVLCTTLFVTYFNEYSAIVTELVPANSKITKIYASMQQDDLLPIDGGRIEISNQGGLGDTIFAHSFGKDPNIGSGGYETTLVQPLYVGPEDVEVRFVTFIGEAAQAAKLLEITVVYCPAAE